MLILKRIFSVQLASMALFLLFTVVSTASADSWTGGAGADDNWSTNLNWLDGSAPTITDSIIFNASDSGNTNVVDTNISVTGIEYLGNSIHTTDLNGTSTLAIEGPVSVGLGNTGTSSSATWTNGGTVTMGNSTTVQTLNIGTQNSTTNTSFTNTGSLTVDGTVFNAFMDNFYVGRKETSFGGGGGVGTFSIIDAGSILNIDGTTAVKPNVHIGYNQDSNQFSGGFGNAVGTFDALESAATVNLHVNELNVGFSNGGAATGTLKWNQSEVIDATSVYFGRGKGATGILDVPTGGTLKLGTASDRVTNLRIAYDDTVAVNTGGTTTADLDFTVTNPTFEAYVESELSIGRRVTSVGGSAQIGTLKLGSNSTLEVGTTANLADVYIGSNQDTNQFSGGFGNAVGTFDALESAATVNLHVNELNVGFSNGGAATGTLKWNQSEVIDATSVYFGRGKGATGILDVPTGGTLKLGTASDRVTNLRIAYDDTVAVNTGGTTTADLDFTVTNPTFEAYVESELSIGRRVTSVGGSAQIGTLKLGSNSTLEVGTTANLADVYIGSNQDTNQFSGGFGNAVGTFDALESAATVNLHVNELNVGFSNGGAATGTLKWNQSEVIDATSIYFGRGKGATGILDVPTGGTLKLGTASDRVTNLRIAYDDTVAVNTGGTTTADLDFTVTNPTFEAYVESELSIGRRVTSVGGSAQIGTLKLGSNSTLEVGTTANLADVYIGSNQDINAGSGGFGNAVGTFDASAGNLSMELNQLNVGRSNGGAATGIFTMGTNNIVNVATVNIGSGANATGTVNLTGGIMDATTINLIEGDFNFTGGRLEVDTFNGTLIQQGGTLAPDNPPATSTINGDYFLYSLGTLEIELLGLDDIDYDNLIVNGLVDLNSDNGFGGLLDLALGFAPTIGDTFTILQNDGTDAIAGNFFGLSEGSFFNVLYDSQTFGFDITYLGGTGNDVVLSVADSTTSTVPEPATIALLGIGLAGLAGLGARRKWKKKVYDKT